ncbi:MAG: LD-carboxypeptidase [Bacteriovoracia bacterium]
MEKPLVTPRPLRAGDTIGVFTPSSPGYKFNNALFENGLSSLQKLGFKIRLGKLTEKRSADGYRSGAGAERADEFMSLIRNPQVNALMATIGGYNSNSMIPFLDFDEIRESRKVICGYSDVTSLHLSILKFSRLRTFYGPTVMCWFGEWPNGIEESSKWFLDAVMENGPKQREIVRPSRWSNHKRSWTNDDWKNLPREWIENDGWQVIQPGLVEAPIVAVNLNTFLSAAGTPYWPDLKGKILLLEEMDAPLMKEERGLRQLQLMGAFDSIAGLIFSRPEVYSQDGSSNNLRDLIVEVIGNRNYPIIYDFDCGHTVPMITVPQEVRCRLDATGKIARFSFLESSF